MLPRYFIVSSLSLRLCLIKVNTAHSQCKYKYCLVSFDVTLQPTLNVVACFTVTCCIQSNVKLYQHVYGKQQQIVPLRFPPQTKKLFCATKKCVCEPAVILTVTCSPAQTDQACVTVCRSSNQSENLSRSFLIGGSGSCQIASRITVKGKHC